MKRPNHWNTVAHSDKPTENYHPTAFCCGVFSHLSANCFCCGTLTVLGLMNHTFYWHQAGVSNKQNDDTITACPAPEPTAR